MQKVTKKNPAEKLNFSLGYAILIGVLFCFSSLRAQNSLDIYGYFSAELERGWGHPTLLSDSLIEREEGPAEFSVHSFNLITQYSISDQFRFYANLNGITGKTLEPVNVWGEYSQSQYLTIRFGKTYRKFGLYNEILDAAPIYFGIDPPEHMDESHLLLSRTTNLMLYGNLDMGEGNLYYSVSTDNGEGIEDKFEKALPFGWDLNYKWGSGDYTIGASGYTSFGDVHSNVGLHESYPTNGVFPWMEKDKFSVISAYAEARLGNLTLQAEVVNSPHKAERNIERSIEVVENAELNPGQLSRFLIDPSAPADPENINTTANYSISAYYIRAAYSFDTPIGVIAPFGWLDYYKNPENINSEEFGGDGETGASDTGIMGSLTLGVVYWPLPSVAFKIENENHYFEYQQLGKLYSYDLRFNLSYIFGR